MKFSLKRKKKSSFACCRIKKWLPQTHKYLWDICTTHSDGNYAKQFLVDTSASSFMHCSIGEIENEVKVFFKQLPFNFICAQICHHKSVVVVVIYTAIPKIIEKKWAVK